MKRLLYLLPLALGSQLAIAQTGNHVFSGGEATNFSPVSLGTPGGQTWSTDRADPPGYFSAIAPDGAFTDAADDANVNGYVKYYANGAPAASFAFPVGTGADLRELEVSGAIPGTAELATAWIAGDPSGNQDPTGTGAAAGAHNIASVGAGIVSVSPAGQWDWQDLAGNAAGLTITVSLPDVSGFATTANLRLVGWNGTEWIDLSGAATASGNAENSTLSGTMQAGITAIGIGSITVPLPVDWLAFTATLKGRDADLDWATARETNTDRFEVEYGTDGRSFSKIGTVAAAGNSSTRSDYTFTHKEAALLGVPELFYRIRQVDRDGQYTYSIVRAILLGDAGTAVIIYPNPVQPGGTLQVKAPAIRSIQIMGIDGKQLWQCKYEGAAQATVSTSGFSAGAYLIRVNEGHAIRFVVR